MLAAGVAAGAGLDWHDDNGVHDRLGFLGGAHCLLIIHLADCVAAVSDRNQHFSSVAPIQRLSTQIERVIECGRRAQANPVNPAVNRL